MNSRMLIIPVVLCAGLAYAQHKTTHRPIATIVGDSVRPGKEISNPADGSVLIEIPAGSFIMGSNDYDEEKPVHTVTLGKYYIGKYEVTVGQFKKFCDATGKTLVVQPDGKAGDNYPVVNVTWNDAKAYCDWAGLRLPTEAEWEKAARGPDGRKYPWGNRWDAGKCNNAENSAAHFSVSPVGSFPAGVSPYGVHDMAGNVWEWCNDRYDKSYYGRSPSSDPPGPPSGDSLVSRGGSWNGSGLGCRSSARLPLSSDYGDDSYGFRVAK